MKVKHMLKKRIERMWMVIGLLALATMLAGCSGVSGLTPGGGPGKVTLSAPVTYTVQSGDCLSCIAARYGVTTQALIDVNRDQYPSIAQPSSSNRILVGWVLTIPAGGHATERVQPAVSAPAVVGSSAESAAPAPSAAPAVTAEPAPTTAADNTTGGHFDYEAALEIVRLTNAEREKAGLNALTVDEGLMDIARRRTVEIVADYNHNGLRAACAACGENINQAGASQAVTLLFNGWMGSAGHTANILRPGINRLGVGVYILNGLAYGVQEFAY